MRSKNYSILAIFLVFLVFCGTQGVFAQGSGSDPYRSTNFPLPRFASVADDEVFVRSGPGQKYPIKWVIERHSLPVEIVLEFENWRKIKDFEGQEGWVYHTLLSGQRTAIVQGKGNVPIYSSPFDGTESSSAVISAYLESNVLVHIEECDGTWCEIYADGFSGWIQRNLIWGVYADENFN